MKHKITSIILSLAICLSLLPAVALPAAAADVWDGTTSDTSWYNDSFTNFTISTAAQLAGLRSLVNQGTDFSGKTITLEDNLDLGGNKWTPIGYITSSNNETHYNRCFAGTFNGNNKTISGLNVRSCTNRLKPF